MQFKNGDIYDGENVVCRSLPIITDVDGDFLIIDGDVVSYAEDGTVVKVYFDQSMSRWKTSTTRCIDAKNSRFTSEKSFDEMFWEIYGDVIELFEPEYTYIFVLKHIENRIVLKHPKNSLIFLAKIQNVSGDTSYTHEFHGLESVTSENVIEEIPDTNKVSGYMVNSEYRGIIVKRENQYFKYDFPEYSMAKKLRGNAPDIRYTHLVHLHNIKKALQLTYLYPEYSVDFYNTRRKLYELCVDVHNVYKCGNKVSKSSPYFYFISKIYKKHGKHADIDDITFLIYKLPVKTLYKSLFKT